MSQVTSDESHFAFLCDRHWLIGAIVGGVFYGLHTCLYGTCTFFLLRRSNQERMKWFLLGFTFLLFAAGTFSFVTMNQLTVLAFVDNRLYPGGPTYGWLYAKGYYSVWESGQNVAYLIAEVLSDGLLLFRVWTVWERNYLICILPAALLLALIGLGIECIKPVHWIDWPHLIESWLGCAVSLNILLSGLIVIRLALHAHHDRAARPLPRGIPYMSIAAIVIESSALYSVANICYVIVYSMPDNPANSTLVWQILAQIVCISPELIILRIALGRAWSRDDTKAVDRTRTRSRSAIVFAAAPMNGTTRSQGEEGTGVGLETMSFSDPERAESRFTDSRDDRDDRLKPEEGFGETATTLSISQV